MRLVLLCLTSIVLLLPACAKRGPSIGAKPRPTGIGQSRDGDFTLKADVIEALEGGPLILRMTLVYRGKKPVTLHGRLEFWGEFEANLSLPKGWLPSNVYRIYPSYMPDRPSFETGEEHSAIVYAHERFGRIPSGLSALKVSYVLQLKDKPDEDLSAVVAVDVQPATPERVEAVRRRIEASLNKPHIDDAEGDLFRWIYGTRHLAFVPLALRMIQEWDFRLHGNQLLDFSYCVSDSPKEVHARLVELACKPGWKSRVDLFRYWRDRGYDDTKAAEKAWVPDTDNYFDQYWPSHRTALPPPEFGKLLKAKNPWTRILTCVTFPSRCPQQWKRTLLEDCRQLTRPLPTDQFAQLLRDLDDDGFAVRAKASAQLVQLGERVEARLKQALRMPLSLEAKRRIRFALEKIAKTPRPLDCDRVIRYLIEMVRTPEADAILTALAQGDPKIPLTKYVQTALHERQKLSTQR